MPPAVARLARSDRHRRSMAGLVLATGSPAAAQAVLSNRPPYDPEDYAIAADNTGPYRYCVDCLATDPWEGPDER